MLASFFGQKQDSSPKRLNSEGTMRLLKAYATKWVQETRANQMLEETITCLNDLPVLASCYPDGNNKIIEDLRNRASTISQDLVGIRAEKTQLQEKVNSLTKGNEAIQELLATWIIHTCDMARTCYFSELTEAKISHLTEELSKAPGSAELTSELNENKALLNKYKEDVESYFQIVHSAEQALYTALGIAVAPPYSPK